MYPHIRLAEKVLRGTEKLGGSQIFAMTMIGLAVVFSALLILVIYLCCSGSIFKKTGGQKKSAPAKAAPAAKPVPAKPAPAAPAARTAPAAPAGEDDSEVIAVIMAAISAMGAAEGKTYQLRSVRPVSRGSGRSAWAQAGLSDATRPF
ncbi:MAG: OadG family protein [Oscillospiraceae bacterium]|nr:OadG family protein [Oscillospiraceae bacterium]